MNRSTEIRIPAKKSRSVTWQSWTNPSLQAVTIPWTSVSAS